MDAIKRLHPSSPAFPRRPAQLLEPEADGAGAGVYYGTGLNRMRPGGNVVALHCYQGAQMPPHTSNAHCRSDASNLISFACVRDRAGRGVVAAAYE